MPQRFWTMMRACVCMCALVVLVGCEALSSGAHGEPPADSVGPRAVSGPPPSGNASASGPAGTLFISPPQAPLPGAGAPNAADDIVIPTDIRPIYTAARTPLPISGGTLILNGAADTAIAADPERDRVSVVRLYLETLLHTIELEPGDQPSRMVEDALGHVHVVLRGADQIATLDPEAGVVLRRRDVCVEPRGIAFDPERDVLHVACASGGLWTLPVDSDVPARTLDLGPDLRDVLVREGGLWVTRFRSAELLELDEAGAVVATHLPNAIESTRGIRATEVEFPRFTPNGAYRTLLSQDGSVVMLHQRALVEPIKIDPNMPATLNGYYAGACGGIVESALTTFHPDGTREVFGSLRGALAVDLALAGDEPAVAFAGEPDMFAPRPGGQAFPQDTAQPGGSVGTLQLLDPAVDADAVPRRTCASGLAEATQGQSVAVAANADGGMLVAFSREPAQLEILRKPGGTTNSIIALGGDSMRDTGHGLFHRSPGGGVACASCHLEGGDDAHVWNFDPLGPRRTQSVYAGLEGTEPFHWEGDLPDLEALLEEVMVVRMGGVHQSPERIEALAGYMFALRPPAPRVSALDPAAQRGQTLFESAEVGCAECHQGAALTDSKNYDVGTGEALQVPSLRGIGYRAPFIHDGCAATLRERFDPKCGGGDAHGHTSQLRATELDDLIAYLQSL